MGNRLFGLFLVLLGLGVFVAATFGTGSAGQGVRIFFAWLAGAIFMTGILVNIFLGSGD